MTLRPIILALLAGSVFAALPVAAHESFDHGTLEILDETGVVVPAPASVTCGFSVRLVGLDDTSGFLAMHGPISMQQPSGWMWNVSADPDGPVIGPFTGFPPAAWELFNIVHIGENESHHTPMVPLTVTGPCGPEAVPCPTHRNATMQPDGTALITWQDAPNSNGSVVWRTVAFNGERQIAVLPAGTNRYVDDTVYPGPNFWYDVRPANDPYDQTCGWYEEVNVPGERDYFPCPSGITAVPRYADAIEVNWTWPEDHDEGRLYRSVDGGPMELLKEGWSFMSWDDSAVSVWDETVEMGREYSYEARGAWTDWHFDNSTGNGTSTTTFVGESSGCPIAKVATGWAAPPAPPPSEDPSDPTDPSDPSDGSSEGSGQDGGVEIPNFPSPLAAVLALAGGAFGYILMQRRRDQE